MEPSENGKKTSGTKLVLTADRGPVKDGKAKWPAGTAIAEINLLGGFDAKGLDKAIAAGVVRVNLPGNTK